MRGSTPRCDCRTPGLTPTRGPTPPCRRDPDWDLGPAQNPGTCSTACRQPWWRRSAPRRPRPRRMPPLCTAWLPPPLGLDSTRSALVSTLLAVVSTLLALVSILSPGQYILSHDQYALNPGQYIALVSTLNWFVHAQHWSVHTWPWTVRTQPRSVHSWPQSVHSSG